MKRFILTVYALVVSAIILILLYLVNPFIIAYPKTTLIILALLMLTSIGSGFRSAIEMGILFPMIKIANGINKSFSICSVVFAIGIVIAIVIPWVNGISGFTVWNWIASLGFTMFCFETFYALTGASVRIYNNKTD